MKTVIAAVLIAVFALGEAAIHKECSSSKPPVSVTIPGCDSPPCKLVKGTDVKVQVQFESASATKTLSPKVNTKFLGLSVPYDLPSDQKDGCRHIQSTNCPIDAGEFVIYELSMPILKSYPSIKIEIELNMLGDDNQPHFCFKVDCQVVNS